MKKPKDDGGHAFPGGDGVHTATSHFAPGMSLRDWFAGQALAGMLGDPKRNGGFVSFASDAYGYADAMLKERAK